MTKATGQPQNEVEVEQDAPKEEEEEEEREAQEEEADGQTRELWHGHRHTGSGARIRGISHETCRGCHYYTANMGFEWLHLRARRRRSLEQAIDDHIALVAIRARVMSEGAGVGVSGILAVDAPFEDRLRAAIPQILDEHRLSPEEFGFDMHVSVPTYHWVGRCLHSPYYSIKDVDLAMEAWRAFRDARGQYGVGGAGLLYRCSPVEAGLIWEQVVRVYIDVWAKRGVEVAVSQKKLHAFEASSLQHRCRQRELWERTQLEREERLQRSLSHAQILERARQRRAERRERTRMRREDYSKRRRTPEQRSLRDLRRLEALVARWSRRLRAAESRASLRLRREEAQRSRDALRAAATQRRQVQARRARRDARWRWMRRQDLTTEELLRGWRPPG